MLYILCIQVVVESLDTCVDVHLMNLTSFFVMQSPLEITDHPEESH